ncbi:MAG TPA: hypothetical protein VN516_00900, partial [Candidatus Baltobacteraceae bacterium]|nr:hypothetical protein [Candidatus Baltobacteraceae bacterium]
FGFGKGGIGGNGSVSRKIKKPENKTKGNASTTRAISQLRDLVVMNFGSLAEIISASIQVLTVRHKRLNHCSI